MIPIWSIRPNMLLFAYMVSPNLSHTWGSRDGNDRLGPQLFRLLDAIARLGSLQHAAREIGISYRHAWGLLTTATQTLGTALVKLERGRGATLTGLGDTLLQLDRKAAQQLAPHFARLEREMATAVKKTISATPVTLVIHASNDLALELLRDLAQESRQLRIELHTHGSLESLDSFAHGTCDIAGFHVPPKISPGLARRYLSRLKSRPVQLINLVERQQGLIVARGNPKRIMKLRDLTRAGVRFINRQQGSGTRLLFDLLLAADDLRPNRINGYQSEEFTHGAVAAMVASGMADAGLAIEAAARQHKLEFVPLARERYYLAARDETSGNNTLKTLTSLLRSKKFKSRVAQLPGYDAKSCGTLARLADILPA